MKNIVKQISYLCFFLLCDAAYGQTGTLYRVPVSGTENIVRYEPTSGKHIAYSKSLSGDNVFSLTDMNTLVSDTVENGLNVRDFEIIDGMVFFCGENLSGSGFLGWFDINDLFYAGGIAHIDQTLSVLGLQTLDNIALYHDTTGVIRIAGYGLHSNVVNVKHYRAFEAVGTPAAGMQYRTLDLVTWGEYGDVSDVAVTDNFVVYLSPTRNQDCSTHVGIGILLQPFPKYDMFGSAPFYYHYFQLSYMTNMYSSGLVYVVPIYNDPYNDPSRNVVYPKMVHSIEDEIAVCTYRTDLDTFDLHLSPPCGTYLSSVKTYITHLKFDLSALVPSTNNFIQMTSNVMAKLYNGDVFTLDGFEYDPQTGRYAVLHRHESSAGVYEHAVTTFTILLPPSLSYIESAYQTTFNTSINWLPQSICMDAAVNYTVMGYDMASSEYRFWRNSVVSVSGECDRIVQDKVKEKHIVPEKYEENTAMPTVWKPIMFVDSGIHEEHNYPCEIICQ